MAGVSENNFVVELCGVPAVGKSLCCHTIAINYATNQIKIDNSYVLYIDTKMDFSAKCIENILSECQVEESIKLKIMSKILIEKVFSFNRIYNILKELVHQKDTKLIKFVIIDSISAIWFMKSERSSFKAYARLKRLGQLIKKLNDLQGIKFVLVNLALPLKDDLLKPAMGYVWCRVPKLRVFLTFDKENNQRLMKIEKCNGITKNHNYFVNITHKGFQ